MTRYWLGTSGYHYSEWLGSFYPSDLPEEQRLAFYGRQFRSIELNQAFYRVPTVRTLQAWTKETPEGFLFSLKAPRRITHELKLRDAADPLAHFCDTVKSIKGSLGALLFQIPPFLRKDVPRLEDFLHQLSPAYRAAFEFRNASWYCDEVLECLKRFEVALCISEHDDQAAPFEVTSPFGYFRLRRSAYSDEDLVALAERVRTAGAVWSDAFLYFKHEAGGQGPRLAARLRELLDPQATDAAAVA